jgi:hypothetical protein
LALAVVGAVGAVLAVMVGTVSPAAGQVTVEVNRAVQYGEGSGAPLLLDAYVPAAEGTDRRPAVVLVHGGGGREVFDREARLIAAKGWVAFTIDYRPGAVAAVEDMSVAVTWVRANADRYRVEPGRIAGRVLRRLPGGDGRGGGPGRPQRGLAGAGRGVVVGPHGPGRAGP